METIHLGQEPLDVAHGLSSGQVFGWTQKNKEWQGSIEGVPVRMRPIKGALEVESRHEELPSQVIKAFLGLDQNYTRILTSFPRDRFLSTAIKRLPGLRVFHDSMESSLTAFVCSPRNPIPMIERSMRALAHAYGEDFNWNGQTVYLPPPIEAFADVSPKTLKEKGKLRTLGMARCLHETGLEWNAWNKKHKKVLNASYEDTWNALQELPGVGPKVADCVSLFGLGWNEAFPIDRWILKVLHHAYGYAGTQVTTKKQYLSIAQTARNHFGPYAGWAQNFLFTYARNTLKKGRAESKKKP